MDEVGHKEHAEDIECGEETSTERDPFLATNKHESLFCCKRKGANYLVMQTIQLNYAIVTIYFSYKVGCFLSDEAIGMAFGALGIGCTIYIWAGVMPQMLDAFVISTSVSTKLNLNIFRSK